MVEVKLLKPELVSLKEHPDIDEAWVHKQIKDDPSILGLGNLRIKDSERRQSKAGRLDILLQDDEVEPQRRYELEVQLGATDESHIVRTLEYWDLERRRLPQYDHVAVIAAENITSRFFNVIQLFNRSIPVIALKMVTLKVGEGIVLHFVKVLDETAHRVDDEEDSAPRDRAYWERETSKETMEVVDGLFRILAALNSNLTPHFTQTYIVPAMGAQNRDFLWLGPKRKFVRTSAYLPSSEAARQWRDKLIGVGFDVKGPDDDDGINFRLAPEALAKHQSIIEGLLKAAYEGYQR